ncbi:DUF7109 family protein [Natronosalvus vescus]|uniref:DUF7109 family protein n=1 Tax=Natronosalvus vescus TaxID=2953881 RepID=UPI002091A77A|nr:hypothetical protein [Natronosalvus vescus]
MNETADELAGVVDLFGGLTHAELEHALSEVAFRADGQTVDTDASETAIESALETFALVRYTPENGAADDLEAGSDEPLLVVGPTAFPQTPEHAEDLPHILDVSPRRPDREAVGEAAQARFRKAVDASLEDVTDGDGDIDEATDTLEHLLDVSYDLEAWAPLDLSDERTRLTQALEDA